MDELREVLSVYRIFLHPGENDNVLIRVVETRVVLMIIIY